MSQKYQHHSIDTAILVTGRSVVFIAASFISAIINLFFIGNLSKETYSIGSLQIPTALFLGVMSITLEGSKLFHVIQYNSLKELYHKLEENRIRAVARKWFIGYLFYAILAIFSATFFSFNSLGVSAKQTDSSFQYVSEDYNTASAYLKNIEEFNVSLDNLNKQKYDSTEIDNEYLTEIAPTIQRANEAASKNWQILENDELIRDPFEAEWVLWYKNKIATLGLNNFGITKGTQVRSKLDITLYRTIKQQHIDNEINQVKSSLDSRQSELSEIYSRNNVTTFRELETLYRTEDTGRYSGGGTSSVFKLIGDMIHIDDSYLRCALLLFLSLLVELTIFQTSPKVQISRRMLYQFTQYLPTNFSINRFMNEIDKELVDYDILKVTKKDEKELIKADITLEKAEKMAKAEEAKARRFKAKKVVRENAKPTKEVNKVKENLEIMDIDPKIEMIKPVAKEEPVKVESVPVEPLPIVQSQVKSNENIEIEPTEKTVKEDTLAEEPKKVATKKSATKRKPRSKKSLKAQEPVDSTATVVEAPVKKELPIVDTEKADVKETSTTNKSVSTQKDILHNYRFGLAKESVKDKMILIIHKLFEGAEFKVDTWKLSTKENLASLDSIVSNEQVSALLQRLKSITYGKKYIVAEENGRFYSIFDEAALIKYATAEKK